MLCISDQIRGKAVKSKGHSRNPPKNKNPKRRGIKAGDGSYVPENSVLVTQFTLKFHPGLNVRPILSPNESD